MVVLESFGLGSGVFVGLMTSRLFLGLFTETVGFWEIWVDLSVIGFPGLSFTTKGFHALLAVLNVRAAHVLTGI